LSLPITPLELLLGKYLGLAGALACSTLAGFGLAGIALAWKLGGKVLAPYAGFMGSALLLGLAFLSMALLVSTLARDRVRASGLAIALWFFYVLVYDLLLLGILVLSGSRFNLSFFPVLLFLNPADLFRILNVFGLEEVRKLYGLATIMPAGLASPWVLISGMLLWIVAPLGIAVWRFKRGVKN
jgi:Cu-processing system permease protein